MSGLFECAFVGCVNVTSRLIAKPYLKVVAAHPINHQRRLSRNLDALTVAMTDLPVEFCYLDLVVFVVFPSTCHRAHRTTKFAASKLPIITVELGKHLCKIIECKIVL